MLRFVPTKKEAPAKAPAPAAPVLDQFPTWGAQFKQPRARTWTNKPKPTQVASTPSTHSAKRIRTVSGPSAVTQHTQYNYPAPEPSSEMQALQALNKSQQAQINDLTAQVKLLIQQLQGGMASNAPLPDGDEDM